MNTNRRGNRPTLTAASSCIAALILIGLGSPAPAAEALARDEAVLPEEVQSMIDDSRRLLRHSPRRGSLIRELDRAEMLLRHGVEFDADGMFVHYGGELRQFSSLMHQLAELVEQGEYPKSLRRAMRPVDPRVPEGGEDDSESSAERYEPAEPSGPVETAEPHRPSSEPIGHSHAPDEAGAADGPDEPDGPKPADEPDTQDWIG